MTPIPQATSEIYWWSTVVAAVLDFALLWLLVRLIPRFVFYKLRKEVPIVSFIFWGSLWASVMANDFVWEWCYRFVFPPAARWYWPVIIAFVYGGIGRLFWWFALKLSGKPVFNFLILGGLVSLPGHLWAIFARKIMETPLLQNVSVESALTFGIFEFIFYWNVILCLAAIAHKFRQSWRQKHSGFSENLLVTGNRL